MCGRYAMALRLAQVRQMLQNDNLPVDEAPDDEVDDDGDEPAPRQSYNFAPGYYGLVYRAAVPDWGAGDKPQKGGNKGGNKGGAEVEQPQDQQVEEEHGGCDVLCTKYKLQAMKWGLIPFWTKRNPDYGSMLKTINCRDDSLAAGGGMWASMKARKRCIVLAQGFYEWLKPPGSKDKIPHFVKRKDGKLMLFAGLWDCVQYEDDGGIKNYTYTVITTDSNKQLKFLHDRMPVILDPESEATMTWLDPKRNEWSKELQAILKPYDGELEVYPVSREVGKVGNNSPNFIIPIASKENKNNIANFFTRGKGGQGLKGDKLTPEVEVTKEERLPSVKVKQELLSTAPPKAEIEGPLTPRLVKQEPPSPMVASRALWSPTNENVDKPSSPVEVTTETMTLDGLAKTADDGGMGTPPAKGIKREAPSPLTRQDEPPAKKSAMMSPLKARPKISATRNPPKKSPAKKSKADGSQKITKFFGNSA
ncbi:hypothetical protein B0H63DRAFT_65975 [Podospora didyma]|uniref:Peptidase n=1 Tax=Podospora didyma TaxID=330526 RepID=A0AAE0P8I0_9PEZI|nr:hypothetical protein B0H63DRAFT_65975 [Podospora didyma]